MSRKIKILGSHIPSDAVFFLKTDGVDVPEGIPVSKVAVVVLDEGTHAEDYGLAILTKAPSSDLSVPWIIVEDTTDLRPNDVLLVQPERRYVRVLYREGSNANSLFVTSCCNSRCIMCPQPPREVDDVKYSLLIDQIRCLPADIGELCITGGEPTLLGKNLANLLSEIYAKNQNCHVHVLSNARLCKNADFVKSIRISGLPNISFGVPLYSADPDTHDFIVQTKGAFDETVEGIYNLATEGASIEIRVVLNKQTIGGLKLLAEYIYNKFPYASHVAFMAMEHMGYVKKNWDLLWVDPRQYQDQLYAAARYLHIRGINCSIYNLPFCLCDQRLWILLRQSISDYKVDFVDECTLCDKKCDCSGVFHYQKDSMEVRRVRLVRSV